MSSHALSPKKYVVILLALLALTVLTVGVSFLDLSGKWHVILGISIAVCKASLVLLFFMHLVQSRVTTWAVVLVAAFWFSVVFMALMFTDYSTRASFPFTPGH